MPIYSGHAPGHVRETFCEAVEAFYKWRSYGGPEPTVQFEIHYEPHTISLSAACGLVWNCTDILPGDLVDALRDLDLKRSTYASCCRATERGGARGRSCP